MADHRGRPEEQGSRGKEAQSRQQTHFVAEAPHEQRGGDRHGAIGQEDGGLHELRFNQVQLERLAKLLHEDIREVVGHAPEEEHGGNQREEKRLADGQYGMEVRVRGRLAERC